MTTVHGTTHRRFAGLRDTFAANVAAGAELGGSLAIDIDGERLLDVWGGWADAARTRPWTEDTIVTLWSSTKPLTSLAALVLIDRGLLDVHAPVSTYWPEFAAKGKQSVEVRHLLSHTSGVSGWELPWSARNVYDRDLATRRLAAQAPWWEPGTAVGYHMSNYGHLIGELVRRVTGTSLTDFVRDHLAGPLGADLHIGVRVADDDRVAEIVPPPPAPIDLDDLDPTSVAARTLATATSDATLANTTAWRRAEIGAVNGHGNARALATVMSTISLGGEVNGTRLLSARTAELALREQARGVDLVLGMPVRWSLGFGLPEPSSVPFLPDEALCFWPGWGGSIVVMHPERRLTLAYAMNRMGAGILGSERTAQYVRAAYAALDHG